MAKKKRNPHKREYNQQLKKMNLPEQTNGPTYAFENEIVKGKRSKFIIGGVIVVALIMVVSLILPYLGSSTGSWQPMGIRDEEEVEEVYNPSMIIANQAFTRRDQEYLVVIGSQDNVESAQGLNTSKLPTYYINTDEAINKEIKTNKPVARPTNPSQIGTKELLLLRFKDKKVILSIEGNAKVTEYLAKLK